MDNIEPRPSNRRSWIAKYTSRPGSSGGVSNALSSLPVPLEGQELLVASPSGTPNVVIPLSRSVTSESSPSSPISSKRWSASFLLTGSAQKSSPPLQQLDQQTSQLPPNALERPASAQQLSPIISPKPSEMSSRSSGSFGKMAFSSMMGSLSVLSLSRSNTNNSTNGDEKETKESRGRSMSLTKQSRPTSALNAADTDNSRSRSRARSQSPFSFRRFRTRDRDPSPTPQALPLTHSDADLADCATRTSVRPRTAFADDPDSGDDTVGETDAETEDEGWSEDDLFDPVTERNTERNALLTTVEGGCTGPEGDVDADPDPLGEGVNVVVPPEPYFPSTLNSYPSGVGSSGSMRGKKNPRRRKSTRHEPLPSQTSRPVFQRDRCTIMITQGDPEAARGDRKIKRYIVASDLSEESRYALEWGIGTVLRDGDEMLIVTVVENESKVDPPTPNPADRAVKIRSQQERQGLAYILARQATSLLQRTRLNVKVSCQAWHAKNARHMVLDIVDYNEPTMLIVGSRGVGQVKGILLGSTSHYLIHKCSVPVMVARRRLKRPPKRSAHLAKHRVHVSLAEAGIDRVAPRVDQDVQVMRDEMARDERREGNRIGSGRDGRGIEEYAEEAEVGEVEEGEGEEYEGDDSQEGVKVAGY